MPAHTHAASGLVVTFYRENEPPESKQATDGNHAWAHAIALVAKRETLLAGDTLIVSRADEPLVERLSGLGDA
jgi:hypothetical protein